TSVTPIHDRQSFGASSEHRNVLDLRRAQGEFEKQRDQDTDNENKFVLDYTKRKSVGRIKCFYGSFGTIVRAYSYLRSWGSNIKKVSEGAILNANYLMNLLKDIYELPFNRPCAHEFVLTSEIWKQKCIGHSKETFGLWLPPSNYILSFDSQRSFDDRANRDRE
ncbi:MAG: hypothetical protein ACRD8Z_01960, partial [Nitrososphaeraceae archaeon]